MAEQEDKPGEEPNKAQKLATPYNTQMDFDKGADAN